MRTLKIEDLIHIRQRIVNGYWQTKTRNIKFGRTYPISLCQVAWKLQVFEDERIKAFIDDCKLPCLIRTRFVIDNLTRIIEEEKRKTIQLNVNNKETYRQLSLF